MPLSTSSFIKCYFQVCYWSYLSRTCLEIVLSIGLFLIYFCWGMPNLEREIDCDVHGIRHTCVLPNHQVSDQKKVYLENFSSKIHENYWYKCSIYLINFCYNYFLSTVLFLHFGRQFCFIMHIHPVQSVQFNMDSMSAIGDDVPPDL